MHSNCRYGKNHSQWKNFFPLKEIYFTLSPRLRMRVEFAGIAEEADPKRSVQFAIWATSRFGRQRKSGWFEASGESLGGSRPAAKAWVVRGKQRKSGWIQAGEGSF